MRTEPMTEPTEVLTGRTTGLTRWDLAQVTVPHEDGWATLTFDLWRRADGTYEVRIMHVDGDEDRDFDLEVLDAEGHHPDSDGWYRPLGFA